jgi:hypothetical protein
MTFINIMATSSVAGTDHHSLGRLDARVSFGILLDQRMCIYVYLRPSGTYCLDNLEGRGLGADMRM